MEESLSPGRSSVGLGLGVWMLWCAFAGGTTMIDRPLAEARELISVPLVALFAAAGVLAVVGGLRSRRWLVVALAVLATSVAVTTVLEFADRGVVGAVGSGLALAASPLAAAWAIARGPASSPLRMPDAPVAQAARVACAGLGAALVFTFGTPIVHSWLRGVAPYDLWALTPATLAMRFSELMGILVFLVGVVALWAAHSPSRRLPLVASVLLTGLIAVAIVRTDLTDPLLVVLRVIVVGGSAAMVATLIAVSARLAREPAKVS